MSILGKPKKGVNKMNNPIIRRLTTILILTSFCAFSEAEEAQRQPSISVEDSYVSNTVDRVRQAREKAEQKTEENIINKLEIDRLKSEQKRAEKLFGDRLNSQSQYEGAAATPPIKVQPQVIQIQTQPIQVKSISDEVEKEEMKQEIVGAVRDEVQSLRQSNKKGYFSHYVDSPYYVSGLANLIEYHNTSSVKTDWSAGLGLGIRFPDEAFTLEGAFYYSEIILDEGFNYAKMDQYNFEMSLRYSLFPDLRIRPFVGALASYTQRKYYDVLSSFPERLTEETTRSNSIEFGGLVGVELLIYHRLGIGFEYRYVVNGRTYSDDDNAITRIHGNNGANRVEDQGYSVLSMTARLNF